MQLLTAGLETLSAQADGSLNHQLELRRELEESKTAIASLGSRAEKQSLMSQCIRSAVTTLFLMVRADVVKLLKDLIQAVARAW